MRWLLILSLVFVAGCARHEYNKQKEQVGTLQKVNTLEGYDNFLAEYPDSSFNKSVLYYRDQLWVETGYKNKDRATLIEFLRARPDSAWVERAHYFLENGFDIELGAEDDSCQAACHEGEVEVDHANLSPRHREKMMLARVEKLNTVAAYNQFLNDFPKSTQRDSIIYLRDKLLVDEGIKNKDRQGLSLFVEQNPDSEWFDQAHYYLQHEFNIAELDDTENCAECHKDGIPGKRKRS